MIQQIQFYIISFLVTFFLLENNAIASKRALLIGISNYPECKYDHKTSWNKIHGTNDVELLNNTLINQGFKITTLSDENATASKIRKALQTLLRSVKNGDLIYVHFSGHGQPVEDLSGDETDGWDEAIVPYDAYQVYSKGNYEGNHHILDDELNQNIEKLRAKAGRNGMVYFVIDACHAGSSYRSEDNNDDFCTRGTMRGFSVKRKEYSPRIDKRAKIKISKTNDKADVCVLEACRSYQTNNEIIQEGKFYGSLSYYINKVLNRERLSLDINWTEDVKTYMNKDRRLIRQNVVIETSK